MRIHCELEEIQPGFLDNDYMQEFALHNPAHPHALRPHGMSYTSLSATILTQNGEPRLVVGRPGSVRIISAVVQVIGDRIDAGLDIEAPVSAPRLHVIPPDRLYTESPPLSPELRDAWKRHGFSMVTSRVGSQIRGLNRHYGGVHAVAWEQGPWHGAADSRRDGGVRLSAGIA